MCYTGNKAIHVWDNMGWITLFPTEFLLYIWHLSKVAGGRIRSWLTLSCLWSWVLPWSRPRPTCKCAPPTCPDEILWGYEFPPVVSLSPSGKYVADFSFFDKVAKTKTPPFLNKPRLQTPSRPNSKAIVLETKGWSTEKMRLEESYRDERGRGRGRVREQLSVRISNV